MNKLYEFAVVYDGKITAAKKKAEIEKIEKMVTALGGKVVKIDDWGVKDLAYPIKKSTTGYFIIFTLEMPGASAKQINQKLRLEDQIIRHLLVTVEADTVKEDKPTKAKKAKTAKK